MNRLKRKSLLWAFAFLFTCHNLHALEFDDLPQYEFTHPADQELSLDDISQFYQRAKASSGPLRDLLEQIAQENDCFTFPDGTPLNCFISAQINEQSSALLSWGQGSAESISTFRAFFYLIPEGTGMMREAVMSVDYRIESVPGKRTMLTFLRARAF